LNTPHYKTSALIAGSAHRIQYISVASSARVLPSVGRPPARPSA